MLACIAEYWEDDPDYEDIHYMLNCGEHNEGRYVAFARKHTPIFQDVPDEIDETWQHGVLIGGMASIRDLSQVARAYKLAADELVAAALARFEALEIDYPILFLYRHTIELYLKAMLRTPPEHHDLNGLMELVTASGKKSCGVDWGSCPRFPQDRSQVRHVPLCGMADIR